MFLNAKKPKKLKIPPKENNEKRKILKKIVIFAGHQQPLEMHPKKKYWKRKIVKNFKKRKNAS